MKRKHGSRGEHTSPRRPLSATEEQFRRWDAAARKYGIKWSRWVRRMLDSASERPADPCGYTKGLLRCVLERGHEGRHMAEPPIIDVDAADIRGDVAADIRQNGRRRA